MRYLSKTWRPLVAAIIAALAATPAIAGSYCYGELGAGGNVGTNKLETGGGSVTIATDGYTGSIGAGCDYVLDKFVIGGLVRASLTHITGSGGIDLQTNAAYMGGLRIGYMVNGGLMAYGLVGYQFQKLEIPAVASFDGKGLVLGAGIETDLAANWRMGVEIDRVQLGTFTDAGSGDKFGPHAYSAMVTLKYLLPISQ